MIENINDVLSILSLIIIVLVMIKFSINVLSLHHAKKISRLESEYYDYIEYDDSSEDIFS